MLILRAAMISFLGLSFLFIFSLTLAEDLSSDQGNKVDRLIDQLNTMKGIPRVNILNEISKSLEYSNPKQSLSYAKDAIELAENIGFREGMAEGYMNVGNYYTERGRYLKAIENFQEALELYKASDHKNGINKSLNNIGNVHRYLGNYDTAMDYFLKSLRMSEKMGDKKGVAYSLNNIGIIYALLENYDKVLEYFSKTLKLSEEIGDKKGVASALNNIGLVYEELGEHEKALEYHQKSVEIKKQIGNKGGISSSLGNMGSIYYNMEDYGKALEYFRQSLSISEEIGDKHVMSTSLSSVGSIYLKKHDYTNAQQFFERALDLALEIQAKDLIQSNYKFLSDLFSSKGDYRKALEYYELYSSVKDDLFSEESRSKITELQTRYETEKKEKEIEILKKDKSIQDLKLERQLIVRNAFIAGFVLILCLAGVIYNRYRLKNRANKELEAAMAQLRRTQQQLVMREKMASLGNLAAGVAHEINNPIGAANSAADVSIRAVNKIDHVLDGHQLPDEIKNNTLIRKSIEAIRENNTVVIKAGERVAEIVKSLKNVACFDEAEFQKADIR